MINIPVNEIVAKITANSELSESEVRTKIDEKLKQLTGLVSEQGAAHIVANELGVELVKPAGKAKIRDLFPGMRNVTVSGKVTRKFEVRSFETNGRSGKVGSFFMGDETGQVRVTLWNNQADLLEKFSEGDVVRAKNAFVKENRGYKELHLNNDSALEVNPAGVTISSISESLKRAPAERKMIRDLTGDEESVELLATVVQVYDIRFFSVCPSCGKRVLETSEGARCNEHGIVTPQTNYVVSAFLDDGSDNIRVTFWKQQTQRLTGKSDSEILAYKESPTSFEEVKHELLGEIVKIVGRCKKNETFDRIELTANLVFKNIDPEEELNRMAEESKTSIEKLDASEPVKEEMKKTVEPLKSTSKVEVEEEKVKAEVDDLSETGSDDVKSNLEEEVISLDDLEDLE